MLVQLKLQQICKDYKIANKTNVKSMSFTLLEVLGM